MSTDIAHDRPWRNLRLVVIDTETTGLTADARVLAIAFYIVENAAAVHSWSTPINPAPTPVGATHIHNLDAAKLAAAPPFSKVATAIAGLLAAPGKTVYVAGHNIGYDMGRLHHEFTRLDLPFPTVSMLDTKRIAPALGFGAATSTLAEFAAACGLANPSAHEANANALVTREVLLTCIERFITEGHHDLTLFVSPFIPKHTYRPSDDQLDLTDEHVAAHMEPMDTKPERVRLLDQCLAWDCPILHQRMLDAVIDAKTTSEIAAWATDRLAGTASRHNAGLLAIGADRALRQRRDLSAKFSRHMHTQQALELLDAYGTWDECDTFDVCDRYASPRPGCCRFVSAPVELIYTILYERDGRADPNQAHQFLYGDSIRPLTKKTWFHHFNTCAHTGAAHAAVTAARTLGQADRTLEASKVAGALWRTSTRTPRRPHRRRTYRTQPQSSDTRRSHHLRRRACLRSAGQLGQGPSQTPTSRTQTRHRREARTGHEAQHPTGAPPSLRQAVTRGGSIRPPTGMRTYVAADSPRRGRNSACSESRSSGWVWQDAPHVERPGREIGGRGLLPVEVYDRLYRVGAEHAGLIVEIGTAHGAGTVALASGAASSGKAYRIVTADPFGGALSSRTEFGSPEQNYKTVERNLEHFGVRDRVEIVTGTIEDIRHRDDLGGISVLMVDADGRVDRDLGALYERLHQDAAVVLDDINEAVYVHAINGRRVVDQKHRITAHLVRSFLAAGVLRDAEEVCNTGFFLKGTAPSSAIVETALPAYRELVFADLGAEVPDRPALAAGSEEGPGRQARLSRIEATPRLTPLVGLARLAQGHSFVRLQLSCLQPHLIVRLCSGKARSALCVALCRSFRPRQATFIFSRRYGETVGERWPADRCHASGIEVVSGDDIDRHALFERVAPPYTTNSRLGAPVCRRPS